MRIVFLDMDGVVNSARHFEVDSKTAYRKAKGTAKVKPIYGSSQRNFINMIFPDTVDLLNEIYEKTECKFVLSSSWRQAWSVEKVQEMLEYHGFIGKLIDRTPDNIGNEVRERLGDVEHANHRGHEIQAWLDADENKEWGAIPHVPVKSFVILDDGSDMVHLKHRLVQTSWTRGLEPEHAKKAIELLMESR
jgi:HAD domain in Swiss Army Knife RNA repair proteins